jgi:hypothetical protein
MTTLHIVGERYSDGITQLCITASHERVSSPTVAVSVLPSGLTLLDGVTGTAVKGFIGSAPTAREGYKLAHRWVRNVIRRSLQAQAREAAAA